MCVSNVKGVSRSQVRRLECTLTLGTVYRTSISHTSECGHCVVSSGVRRGCNNSQQVRIHTHLLCTEQREAAVCLLPTRYSHGLHSDCYTDTVSHSVHIYSQRYFKQKTTDNYATVCCRRLQINNQEATNCHISTLVRFVLLLSCCTCIFLI